MRIGFEKFPNDKFSRGSKVVESPEIERLQRKVCNDHLVSTSCHMEEGELPRGFLREQTPHHAESLQGFLSPVFVFELRNPESRREFLVMEASKAMLEKFADPCHNSIEGSNFLEKLDNCMIIEGRIAPHPNLSHSRRKL